MSRGSVAREASLLFVMFECARQGVTQLGFPLRRSCFPSIAMLTLRNQAGGLTREVPSSNDRST
jgi:hypothetical protein